MKGASGAAGSDPVAVEEPLEMIVSYSSATGKMTRNIAVTMRTPGNDEDLAAGFLFTEGIVAERDSIQEIKHIASDDNRILVTLKENSLPVLKNAERNFYTTSSCGVCGKASIDAVRQEFALQHTANGISISAELLYGLQDVLRGQQEVFEETGGIHASALFNCQAKLLMVREDVGRHNALDKLIGAAWIQGLLPLNSHILLLSGRASFELIQKAAMAGIPVVAAVGAPSSLAVEVAKEAGITLIGFLRNNRFNIYSAHQRIK